MAFFGYKKELQRIVLSALHHVSPDHVEWQTKRRQENRIFKDRYQTVMGFVESAPVCLPLSSTSQRIYAPCHGGDTTTMESLQSHQVKRTV